MKSKLQLHQIYSTSQIKQKYSKIRERIKRKEETLSMEIKQFRKESWPAKMPKDKGGNRTSFENGNHVFDPVRILRVVLDHIKKARIRTRIENPTTRIVF